MSVPDWPADLPRPVASGYGAAPQDARFRKTSDRGPPGYRRAFSSAAREVSLAIRVYRAEKAVFDTFFADTTRRGALPFWMPDPVTDGFSLLAADEPLLAGADGLPLQLSARWLCLFGDDLPNERIHKALRFEISFSVWVLP